MKKGTFEKNFEIAAAKCFAYKQSRLNGPKSKTGSNVFRHITLSSTF